VARAVEAHRAAVQQRLRAAELEAARATARATAERKARRLTAGLAAAVLVLVLGGGSAGLWWRGQRAEQERALAEQERAVKADLAEVAERLREWKMAEAHTAMVRAEGRVAGGGPAPLLSEVQRLRKDVSVADELERIRLRRATIVDGQFDDASADRDYAKMFQERGLAVEGEDPQRVAKRIQGSPIRAQLVAALDDWAIATDKQVRGVWLLGVARQADPGPWSDRFRDHAMWRKPAALERLAKEAQVAELSPQLLTALGLALGGSGGDAVPLLKAAQACHPADFWLNFDLGNALVKAKSEEAAGYYRAALALRPDTPVVYHNLGLALQDKGQMEEAITAYRQAIQLDPTFANAHIGLGVALDAKGQRDEAIRHYRKAITLDPKYASAHYNLGGALYDKGELNEAIEHYRQAIQLDPKHAKAHYNLGNALHHQGRLDEAIPAFRRAIELDAKQFKAHTNLGIVLHKKGRLDEAIREHRKALALAPTDTKAHNNLGLALLAKGRRDEAIQEYRRAIDLDPKYALAYRNLGHALLQGGRFAEAQAATRRCLDLLPPNHPLRQLVTQQLRNCERWLALEERLPGLLQGKAKPADAAERLALAQLCQQYKQLYTASARFYAEAFADQPRLARDPRSGHRYNAACAAALAAAGQGKDTGKLDDKERARLRQQALDWLRADLAAWARSVDQGPPQARLLVQQKMQHWQKDPDLAGLRDTAALEKLPAAERAAWHQLWADVAALLKRVGKNRSSRAGKQ
jgi:tetratricopeptide (TPR) repeat protein